MINLVYKASNIAKAEQATGKNLFDCIAALDKSVSFADLMFLIQAGGGTEDDFDALFASGIENMMRAILEGINNAGFLGEENKLDVEALMKTVHEEVEKAGKTLPNSGEATNQ